MICEKNVNSYCSDDITLIENYNDAINSTEMWVCHHRLEIQDDKRYSKRQLIEMRLYYDRPHNELIFMTTSEHMRLHTIEQHKTNAHKLHLSESNKGKHSIPRKKCSNERKLKISNSEKGKIVPKYNWLTPLGEIRIMDKSNAHKHHPDWKLIEESTN